MKVDWSTNEVLFGDRETAEELTKLEILVPQSFANELSRLNEDGELSHVYGGVRRDSTTDFTLTAVQPVHTSKTL